jgi:NitT/TauT family transport system permease protein
VIPSLSREVGDFKSKEDVVLRKPPLLLGFYAEPRFKINWALIALPFVLLLTIYLVFTHNRHVANPDDKLLPSFSQMAETVKTYAFEKDADSEEWSAWDSDKGLWQNIVGLESVAFRVISSKTGVIMLDDTVASLRRITIGVTISAMVGLILGIGMGLFPGMRLLLLSFIIFLSIIPPLAMLPILFIAFGTEELSKVALIIIGTLPIISRDIYLATSKIPPEQKAKALTLGASQFQVAYRIVLPQIMPRLIDTVRLCLGNAWLFLIAAEAIVADNGLGFRIYVVRRRLAMDVILPYVAWITLITFATDYYLKKIVSWRYSWYLVSKE